jgi:hypothetical protein
MGKMKKQKKNLGAPPQLEYWNVGILGFGLRLVEPTPRAGSGLGEVIVGMVYWENHIDRA